MVSSVPEPLVVIVADDDDDLRALVTATLRADGCTTLEARDGQELLALLDQAAEHPGLRPDVLVSDVKMPRLSGLGVLEALRRADWKLPVVMMTIVKDDSIRSVAERLGAAGVLRKPFQAEELLAAVRGAHAASLRG